MIYVMYIYVVDIPHSCCWWWICWYGLVILHEAHFVVVES